MPKLKFKIITYDYTDFIKENYLFDEDFYSDNLSLEEVINSVLKKNNINIVKCLTILNFDEITWGQYFKNCDYEGLHDERTEYDYYNYKIKKLCEQFHLENQMIILAVNPPIGADMGRNRGIHYFFHTNERDIHHVPHIHVKSGNIEYRVNLNTLEIMDKIIFKNPRKNKLALNTIRDHQQDLLNYWNKVVVNGESIKYKMFVRC